MTDPASINLLEVLQRLITHNRDLGDRQVSSKTGASRSALALLYGLQAHAYSLAEATIGLWDRPGLRVAAVPLTRAIFEVGVTAQWVAQVPEATGGVVGAFVEHRRKLANNLERVPGPFADAAPDIRAATPDVTSEETATAQHIASITAQFVNGDELYAYYRILCGQTHAGVEVADKWVALDENGVLSFLAEPVASLAREESLAIYGLLLAASAFEENVQTVETIGKDVTGFLDEIAREVGIPNTLELKSVGANAGKRARSSKSPSGRSRQEQRGR